MKQLIFILFFLFVNSIQAQKNVNKGQRLIYLAQFYEKTDKLKALEKYKEAFTLCPELIESNFAPYSVLCVETNASHLIAKAIKSLSFVKLLDDNYFSSNIDMKLHFEKAVSKKDISKEKLIKNYYSNEENYDKIAFEKELIKIDYSDQYIRALEEEQKNECLSHIRNKQDSLNVIKLIDLTKKFGWNQNGWWTLWHQRGTYPEKNYVWSYIIPFINSLIKDDFVRKDFFIPFEKAKAMVNKTIYPFDYLPPLAHKYSQKDINNIDRNRKMVGLPPLYFEKYIYPEKILPTEYHYDPKNLLSDLINL